MLNYQRAMFPSIPVNVGSWMILDDLGILALDGLVYVGETTDTPNDNRNTEHIAWKKSESPGGRWAKSHSNPIINAGWWCNNHLEKYEFVNEVGMTSHI